MFFVNRLYVKPKPPYPTPISLRKAMLWAYLEPSSIKNTMTLAYRYLDNGRADEVYLYLPALRRVLRGEAGQRSAPLAGSLASLDDAEGFDGRIPEFTYKFIGEQKVLSPFDATLNTAEVLAARPKDMPYQNDGWEVRDCYVIDIFPKNPKYPQSKKRIYMDKETLFITHAIMWDRAGAIWKIMASGYERKRLEDGEIQLANSHVMSVDTQFGMAQAMFVEHGMNKGLTYEDMSQAALPRKARQ